MTTTTKFQIDLKFQPLHTAEEVLSTLYTQTSTAIDQHNLTDVFCNIYLQVSKKVTVFAEVKIDTTTMQVQYFVTSNQNTAARIPALNYTQAVRELRHLGL